MRSYGSLEAQPQKLHSVTSPRTTAQNSPGAGPDLGGGLNVRSSTGYVGLESMQCDKTMVGLCCQEAWVQTLPLSHVCLTSLSVSGLSPVCVKLAWGKKWHYVFHRVTVSLKGNCALEGLCGGQRLPMAEPEGDTRPDVKPTALPNTHTTLRKTIPEGQWTQATCPFLIRNKM